MAFATFALFPAAPPWLASQAGELDPTIRLIGPISGHMPFVSLSFEGLFQRGWEYSNPVAAVPSLHAAYTLLITLSLWPLARWARPLLALYPLAMAFALVYTAEHYLFDILLGWSVHAGGCVDRGPGRGPASFGLAHNRPELVGPRRVEDQVGDERRPAGLVHRPEAGAVVAVEVLEEEEVVLPRRIRLEPLGPAVHRPAAVGAGEPDRDERSARSRATRRASAAARSRSGTRP